MPSRPTCGRCWNTALATALGVATALADEGPSTVQKDHVAFYGDCWNVSLSGPDFREAAARKAAENQLRKPTQVEIAGARVGGVEVFVWSDEEMRCGNKPAPLRL